MPVREIELDEGIDYEPNAMTPLYDAIGTSVMRLKSQLD